MHVPFFKLVDGDEMNRFEIKNKPVSWKVMDIEIHGTATFPVEGKTLPGVVLVAGSGPTDRDWCSPLLPGSNGSGKLLAEELAGRGYATLRYDKMASGPHVKENLPRFAGKASMESHKAELAGAVAALQSLDNVATDRIFALTNSEGAIHAVNYQQSPNGEPFRGMVLTSAPGRSVGQIGREQLESQLKSITSADEIMKHYDNAISKFLEGNPMELDDSLPEGLKRLLTSLEIPANLPFSRELWAYSLPEHVGVIKEPVLVVIGKKDIQVNWKKDGEALELALSENGDAEFAYPENANHVLKFEGLPLEKLTAEHAATSYNSSDANLDRDSADLIFSWLETH